MYLYANRRKRKNKHKEEKRKREGARKIEKLSKNWYKNQGKITKKLETKGRGGRCTGKII